MITMASVLKSRYSIDILIDRGGMANVYRARDLRLEREVAVKALRDVEHERRFVAEARTLASIEHPNLVRVLDAGTDNGDAFLVLELLGGATVRELLCDGPLDAGRVARIGSETAAALDYIHRRGIVHRDVKPANLMLDDHGSVRLADFGIARLVGGTAITPTHLPIGTMAYIAPEQLECGDVGPPADVYALGLVLIECLTGRRAFDGPPAEAAAARLSRDPEVPAGLPGPWATLLKTMTAREPEARPTAATVRDQLRSGGTRAADGAVTAAPAPAVRTDVSLADLRPIQRARPARRRWTSMRAVLAALLAVSAAAAVAYRARSNDDSPSRTAENPTTSSPTSNGAARSGRLLVAVGAVASSGSAAPILAAGASVGAVVAYGATSDEGSPPRPAELPNTAGAGASVAEVPYGATSDEASSPPPAETPAPPPPGSPGTPPSAQTAGTVETPGSPGTPEASGGAASIGPAGPSPPTPRAPSAPSSPPPPPTSPPPPSPPGATTCLGLALPLGLPCPISLLPL